MTEAPVRRMTRDELWAERRRLSSVLSGIDLERRANLELIKVRNRQGGVSKDTVESLRAKDVRLFAARVKVHAQAAAVIRELRAVNEAEARGRQRAKVSFAEAFQRVVRGAVSKAQYAEWEARAKMVIQPDTAKGG